jgi:DnaJ-class molecular chaperone
VEVPTNLSAEQKAKLREFEALSEDAESNPSILEKAKKLFR